MIRLDQDKQLDWFLRLRHLYRFLRFFYYRRLKDSEHLETAEQIGLEPRREKVGFAFSRLNAIIQPAVVLHPNWWAIYDWISWDYLPRFYPGKLTIFWDSEDVFRRVTWRKVEAKGVEVHIIPGSHVTCRTEYLHVLAEHLSTCLNKAQAAEIGVK